MVGNVIKFFYYRNTEKTVRNRVWMAIGCRHYMGFNNGVPKDGCSTFSTLPNSSRVNYRRPKCCMSVVKVDMNSNKLSMKFYSIALLTEAL